MGRQPILGRDNEDSFGDDPCQKLGDAWHGGFKLNIALELLARKTRMSEI